MEFLRQNQLDIMLIFSGICGILVFFVCITKILSRRRKFALILMELSAMFLLLADRWAYIFRGDVSTTGWWMVRICNFLVFALSLLVLFAFNLYLIDLYMNEGDLSNVPVRLKLATALFIIGEVLIVISQFTGFYYTFDEFNQYHRASGFLLCYSMPLLIILLQLSVVIQYNKRVNRLIRVSIVLFSTLPIVATFCQIFIYGLSLTNMTLVGLVVILYCFELVDMNNKVERANQLEIDFLKDEQRNMQIMFEQTAEALANAIDAKDKYTHGHSNRVAEYSKRIASLAGKSKKECDEVYYAALLHDVGKIGVPNNIIQKEGRLSDEEFAEIKKHPVIGRQILSSISKSPYLSVGANYHHERYDGKGYPEGLKGNDIPDIARIIAVADAYDAMTSKRSYRDPIPQDKVREEIVKGIDTQFDPVYAKLMLHLIDLDLEYEMKEREEVKELAGKNEMTCTNYRSSVSEGIILTPNITRIKLHSKAISDKPDKKSIPSFILFDSLDGRIYETEDKIREMIFTEFAEIRFDGETVNKATRKIQTQVLNDSITATTNLAQIYKDGLDYEIEAVKFMDHILLKISDKYKSLQITIAMQDSSRYAYLALTGEDCFISNVDIKKDEVAIDENYIPRIAPKISYTDVPAGDIPNVQVDGWRSAASQAIPLINDLKISFHSKSLPTARLIWHCPFVSLFYSDDKKIEGPGYKEYLLLRLDGENWEADDHATNKIIVNKNDDFLGWDFWKNRFKEGLDCTVKIQRKGNIVTIHTENNGIAITSITTLKDNSDTVYVALTGDQTTITNIKIN